eukprot:scaffold14940_cov200-Alexandrium_tamarense.AAC.5
MAQNNLDTTTTHDIVDVARAAIARERLRDSITKRMSHLNGPEVKFLTALNNESVTMAALENTVHVLDNDPLYNPALRSDEKDNGDMYAENDGASGVFQESKDRRSQYRRKSSVIEASMWMMSSAKLDGKQGLDGNVHGTPKRRRTNACEFEESVCDFSNREKKQNNQQHSTSGGQQKDPRRMNSRAGDAIDPLLIAIPMETNEGNSSRQSSESRGEKNKVGMDTFTCSQKEKSVSNDEAKTEVSLQALLEPFLCCGMGSITFDTEEKKANEPANDADTEVGSLESKKRFLHLENNESNRHAHLSTWMGSPEDFPILGLGVKGRNDSEDPLDPHVLSPLLMKCLREHFPYALREENFWLKYSMVRDGASLEKVFDTLRHSQHTVLAIETTKGEVFGSFTSTPWRSNGNKYYGSCEAFVWMLRKAREDCSSLDEYVLRESSLEVFPWNSKGGNRNVQLSNTRKLFVGGGEPDKDVTERCEEQCKQDNESTEHLWGMALALDKDLFYGSSSRCATFDSKPLIDRALKEGSEAFEVMNMEIWSLTPCMTEELAQNLELGRTFVMGLYK